MAGTIRRNASASLILTRRELLAGVGAGTGALLLERAGLQAQAPPGAAVVFTHTTVITHDGQVDDVALAVEGGRIAAIGPTDEVVKAYPRAEQYDGRGKALVPGLVNCHAHMGAVIARGFNEDFGFPNTYRLAVQPGSLLSPEESILMVRMAALEAIRTGTTTIVQFGGGIAGHAEALADSGLRCVFAEGLADVENPAGPVSAERLRTAEAPRFSPKLREAALQRATDLFEQWHGARDGRITVMPSPSLAENASPELLRAARAFAEKHDTHYTIHLNQSRWEVEYMRRHHGLDPTEFLAKHDFLGPRLFAAHCRYVTDNEIALLGKSRTIVTHQAVMAGNRGVNPPIPALREAGCPIAQGTDNNTQDMVSNMRIALVMERIARADDEVPGLLSQPEDMLEDAALGGARAVNQARDIGSLEVGKKADILVLDTQRAHLVPSGRILSAWLHNGQASDIESMMVDGRFVMRDHKVLTMDEAALIREADAVGRRVWGEVLKQTPVKVPRATRRG
jgi:5-methylthioadenosine/S-adenosylhomocysteine deaminase